MQKSKILFKVIGITIFILVISALPNLNKFTFANDITKENMETIQNAIKGSTNSYIKICFSFVASSSTVDAFKVAIKKGTTSIPGQNIEACISSVQNPTGDQEIQKNINQAYDLLEKLKKYVTDPSDENLKIVLSVFGIKDTTGCITDKTDPKLKNWLEIISKHSIVKSKKASICPEENPATLVCLQKIVDSIREDAKNLEKSSLPGYISANTERARLYNTYADRLKDFIDCPTQTNFNNLDIYYTNFFVPGIEKLEVDRDGGPCSLFDQRLNINVLDWLSGGLLYSFYVIFRGLLVLVLKGFQYVLNPSNFGGYIKFLDTNLVETLWGEMLKLANLGIIFGMVVIAIATILRNEKFGWKKNLPKLLIIALLVNFSLIIVGIFVDMSNYLSNVAMTGFSSNALPTLIVDNTICPTVAAFYELGSKGSFWQELFSFNILRTAVMGLIMTGLFLFQFVGLLLYVFMRVVTIIACLITSPLAFLSLAFPGLEKVGDFWRQRLQQSLVSLPILCLTLYFSLRFVQITTDSLTEQAKSNLVITLMYAIFVIVFIQLVRYVAKALGVEQVEKGFQLAKKAVNTIAMAGVAMVGGTVLTGIAGSQAFRTVGQKLTQTPILNKIGYKMLDQSDAARFTNIRKSEEKMKTRSKDEILAITNGEAPLRANKAAYADYMGARSFALKSGWLKHDDKAIKAIKKDIENNNPDLNAKDLVHAFPQLFTYGANGKTEVLDTTAPDYTKKVADNIKKNISAEDMPRHTEQVIEAIKDARGNVDEFLQEMVFAKTNQLRALLDNVAGDEYATGDKLTKATGIKGPWSGQNGQIATVLKNLEKKAQHKYEALAKDPRATEQDLDRATEERIKAQQAVDELNNKLKSSQAFRETLGTEKI